MTCSARSFGSAKSSASRASSSSSRFAAFARSGERTRQHVAFVFGDENFGRSGDQVARRRNPKTPYKARAKDGAAPDKPRTARRRKRHAKNAATARLARNRPRECIRCIFATALSNAARDGKIRLRLRLRAGSETGNKRRRAVFVCKVSQRRFDFRPWLRRKRAHHRRFQCRRIIEDRDGVAHRIENQKRVGKEQMTIVQIAVIGRRVRQFFEKAHQIPAQKPDGAAAKTRQIRAHPRTRNCAITSSTTCSGSRPSSNSKVRLCPSNANAHFAPARFELAARADAQKRIARRDFRRLRPIRAKNTAPQARRDAVSKTPKPAFPDRLKLRRERE